MLKDFAPFLGPALALLIIFRRGTKPRRVKVNSLWRYPILISVMAMLSLSRSHAPGILAIVSYAAAILAGGALGWFTAQHAELTLDKDGGTIMSKPTLIGTAITAAAFLLKFALDFYVNGTVPSVTPHPFVLRYTAGLTLFANAMMLLAVARTIGGAAHMWIRTRPLVEELAQHKAAQNTITPPPAST